MTEDNSITNNNHQQSDNVFFSASIRVVKSIAYKDNEYSGFGFDTIEVIKETMIEANDKNQVKEILSEKYPQFFQNGKVYEKETKDEAQFFYVIIKKIQNWDLNLIKEGNWTCDNCGEIHENKYVSRPRYTKKPPFQDFLFCDNDNCLDDFKKKYYKDAEMPDDENYLKSDSLNYIYKCTEKQTNKSYIGKTRNAPFFRWWNHLTHSKSPFGIYLRKTKLSDWTFEVLEELPSSILDKEVFRIESEYISKYDAITNGFNSLISNKNALSSSGNMFDTIPVE
jgi:hypothetical protein